MYCEKDLADIRRQSRKRILLLSVPSALLMAAVTALFLARRQTFTVLVFTLLCFMLIFAWSLFISPLTHYARFLSSVLYGKNRDTEGYFLSFSQEVSVRDGVRFVPFYINIKGNGNPEDDRLFYWDENLPLPGWKPGEKISVTSQDKSVLAWKPMQ